MDGGSFFSKEVGDTVSLGLSKVPGIEQVHVLDTWTTIHTVISRRFSMRVQILQCMFKCVPRHKRSVS